MARASWQPGADVAIRRWAALTLMFGLALAANAFRNSFQFFLTGVERDLDTSRAAVAGAMSLFALTTGVLAPVAGRLVDRFAPRRVVAGGLGLLGVALLCAANARTTVLFVLAFGLVGGAGFAGVVGAPSQVFVTAWFERHRALAVAFLSNAYSAGLLFLAPVWTRLATGPGWRPSYTVMGVVLTGAGVVALAALRMPPDVAPTAPEGSRSLRGGARAAVRSPTVLLPLCALFACGTAMGLIDTHLVPLLDAGGLAHHHVAPVMSSLGGMIVLGGLGAGWLSDRLGERHRLVGALFLLRVAAFGLLAAPLGTWRYSAFVVVFGLSYTGVIPITVAALSEQPATTGILGAVLGLGMLLHQVGGFVGTYGAGVLYDLTGSYTLPLACVMAIAAVAAAAMMLAARIGRARIAAGGDAVHPPQRAGGRP